MYGRARRLELYRNIGIGIVVLLVIILIARGVIVFLNTKDNNIDFYYLKRYLNEMGFSCESLSKSGGACKYTSDNVVERFARYGNGFDYVYKNNNYVIEIYHVGGKEKLSFTTGDGAFKGYKNLEYNCVYKNNILNEVDRCYLVNDELTELDNEAYIGVINNSMYEVSKMVEVSEYNRDDLINKYVWNKK